MPTAPAGSGPAPLPAPSSSPGLTPRPRRLGRRPRRRRPFSAAPRGRTEGRAQSESSAGIPGDEDAHDEARRHRPCSPRKACAWQIGIPATAPAPSPASGPLVKRCAPPGSGWRARIGTSPAGQRTRGGRNCPGRRCRRSAGRDRGCACRPGSIPLPGSAGGRSRALPRRRPTRSRGSRFRSASARSARPSHSRGRAPRFPP